MSKEKNKNVKTAERSVNITKYILFAVVLIIAGFYAYNKYVIKDESAGSNYVVDPKERIKNIREPQFKKEGELEFLRKNQKEPVRKIDVELAENRDEILQGLMYRRSMDDSKGMLFIFEQEEPQSFWMKNTVIPLDIIYVNSKMEIVKIFKNTVPFSEKSLPSEKPATYVVEVIGGYTDKYGIREGDLISFVKK